MADSPHRIKLSDLEAAVHVPADQMCESQPASEPQDVLGPEELDRRRLLNQRAQLANSGREADQRRDRAAASCLPGDGGLSSGE